MGITLASLDFILRAYKTGMAFGHTLTLGRQDMMIGADRLEAALKKHGLWPPACGESEFREQIGLSDWPFETLLMTLGAERVSSCDVSDFEGASIVHDLNEPVPEKMQSCYDLVIDGGTLEHVFNFPMAIKNAMKMVKPFGHLILLTPANNYFGHGFYQFSPELFYRVLSEENGFEVSEMVALVDETGVSSILGRAYSFRIAGPWYRVANPVSTKRRVTLINNLPVMLFVCARRTQEKAILSLAVAQSYYAEKWAEDGRRPADKGSRSVPHLGARIASKIPRIVRWKIIPALFMMIDPLRRKRWANQHSLKNGANYSRVKEVNEAWRHGLD